MMELKISVGFRTGALAEGLSRWPIDTEFQYSEAAQSFCICVKEEDTDAGALLQEFTGQDGVGAFAGCRLNGAGVFYRHFSQENAAQEYLPDLLRSFLTEEETGRLQELFQNPMVPVDSGVCLWMAADLENLHVFSDLITIGYEKENTLFLLACLCRVSGKWTKSFYADLPDIELFQKIVLGQILLIYREDGSGQRYFALSGQVKIRVKNEELLFAGELVMEPGGYHAQLENCGTVDMLSFIAGAEGRLCLQDLAFHMECRYASKKQMEVKQYFLQGNLKIGEILLSGKLFWEAAQNGTSGYISAELEEDVALESLLHAMFPGYGLQGTLFHIAFLEGSRLAYHFDKETQCLLELRVELQLVSRLELTGKIEVAEDGFRMGISTEQSIHLGPFSLEPAGEDGKLAVDMEYCKDSGSSGKQLNITAGASFMEEKLVGGVFTYQGDENGWSLRAELQIPDKLQILFGSSLTLFYDSREGFRLENLEEISYLGETVDFLKQLKNYMQMGKTDACAALQECAGQNRIHSSFRVQPGLSGSLGQDKAVKITLKCVLRVEDDHKNLLLERRLGESQELALEWKSGMTWEEFTGQVEKLLKTAMDQVLDALFQDSGFEDLERILKVAAEGKLKEYAEGLLCRKLINQENAEKLKMSEPSEGGSGESGSGEGGSGEGGSGEGGFTEIAAEGGTAFGGGTIMEGAGEAFGGLVIITFTGMTGGDRKEGEKLPCPEFKGIMDDMFLRLEMQSVKDADGYEIDIRWEDEGRKDRFTRWNAEETAPQISLLAIPVKGQIYLAVRALYSQDESKSSDWSRGNLVGEVTAKDIVLWSLHQSLCIRDCFGMLETHGFSPKDDDVIREVLQHYLTPKMKEELVKEHFQKQDPAEVCLKHLIREYPHLTSGEILRCMWYEGYRENEILKALLAVREGLTDEDLEGLLDKRIRLEGVTMDLKTKICEVLEAQKNKKLTNQEVLSEIAILLAANDPLKVAAALKEAGCTALKIAEYLVPWMPAEHKAAAVGAILLDPDIYPDTEEKEMRDILSSLCPDENIQQAIEILYPTYVTVKATEIWKDTGIDVAEDEIVTIQYLSGRWKVNPGHRESYDAEGNLETDTPYGYVLEHSHDGCLVGKVGDGEPFYIGKKQEVPRSSGRLYLIANDDIKCLYGVGHEDNEGEITIVIKKEFR